MGSDACPVPARQDCMCKHRLETLVNGGRNLDGPKVAKFFVG